MGLDRKGLRAVQTLGGRNADVPGVQLSGPAQFFHDEEGLHLNEREARVSELYENLHAVMRASET